MVILPPLFQTSVLCVFSSFSGLARLEIYQFYLSSQRMSFVFHWFSLLCFGFLFIDFHIDFYYSLFLLTLDLICFSWFLKVIAWVLFSFLIQVFTVTNFHSSTATAGSHRFLYVAFIFIQFKVLSNFFFDLSTHGLLGSVSVPKYFLIFQSCLCYWFLT